ncbi:hypothetical protein ABW19_dt0203690 [Dactylella cylindrospora]|nr:hypothetical protein ABW19_dt0203690 [Dactylella cylindrospora]
MSSHGPSDDSKSSETPETNRSSRSGIYDPPHKRHEPWAKEHTPPRGSSRPSTSVSRPPTRSSRPPTGGLVERTPTAIPKSSHSRSGASRFAASKRPGAAGQAQRAAGPDSWRKGHVNELEEFHLPEQDEPAPGSPSRPSTASPSKRLIGSDRSSVPRETSRQTSQWRSNIGGSKLPSRPPSSRDVASDPVLTQTRPKDSPQSSTGSSVGQESGPGTLAGSSIFGGVQIVRQSLLNQTLPKGRGLVALSPTKYARETKQPSPSGLSERMERLNISQSSHTSNLDIQSKTGELSPPDAESEELAETSSLSSSSDSSEGSPRSSASPKPSTIPEVQAQENPAGQGGPEFIFDFGFKSLFEFYPHKQDHRNSPPKIQMFDREKHNRHPEIIIKKINSYLDRTTEFWGPDNCKFPQRQLKDRKEGWKNILQNLNVELYGYECKQRCIEDVDIPELIRFLEILTDEYMYRASRATVSTSSKTVIDKVVSDMNDCIKTFLTEHSSEKRFLRFREIKEAAHVFREKTWKETYKNELIRIAKSKESSSFSPFAPNINQVRNYYAPSSAASINLCQIEESKETVSHQLLQQYKVEFDGIIEETKGLTDEIVMVWGQIKSLLSTPPKSPPEDSTFTKGMKLSNLTVGTNGAFHITKLAYESIEKTVPLSVIKFSQIYAGAVIFDRFFANRLKGFLREFASQTGDIILQATTEDLKIEAEEYLVQPINEISHSARHGDPIVEGVKKLEVNLTSHLDYIIAEMIQKEVATFDTGDPGDDIAVLENNGGATGNASSRNPEDLGSILYGSWSGIYHPSEASASGENSNDENLNDQESTEEKRILVVDPGDSSGISKAGLGGPANPVENLVEPQKAGPESTGSDNAFLQPGDVPMFRRQPSLPRLPTPRPLVNVLSSQIQQAPSTEASASSIPPPLTPFTPGLSQPNTSFSNTTLFGTHNPTPTKEEHNKSPAKGQRRDFSSPW